MSDPDPKPDETPAATPERELDDQQAKEVSGGFNPCPEPPGRARFADLATKINIPVDPRPGKV